METPSTQLTRRSFLTTTAHAAGALAASGMAGCSSVDTSGDAANDLASTAGQEETYIGTCHGNCGGRCALKATVREG